jgi:hypothetical protein
MNKFLGKVFRIARNARNPRKAMVRQILRAHGWRLRPYNSAAWYPPGSEYSFGGPIVAEDLRQRGFGFIADQLLAVENMLAEWAHTHTEWKMDGK